MSIQGFINSNVTGPAVGVIWDAERDENRSEVLGVLNEGVANTVVTTDIRSIYAARQASAKTGGMIGLGAGLVLGIALGGLLATAFRKR